MAVKRFPGQMFLPLRDELVVDLFAGGGGASLGIEWGIGRSVDVAVNHDPEAVAMHQANHPHTTHYCESVFKVDPVAVTRNQPVGLLWASPDCFPAGTLVLTRRGYQAIEEIEVGDEVLTHKLRWKKVTEVSSTRRPLVSIKGHGHPGLLVSPEHPFYARRRKDVWRTNPRGYERTLESVDWMPASVLTKGWYWATPTAFPESRIPPVPGRGMAADHRLMWLAGRYLGDGWTRFTETRAELVITCGKHEIEKLRASLNAWAREGSRAGFNELEWHERATGTAYQFTTNHRGLVSWLREHFGHRAEAKRVPAWALGLNVELKQVLLEGYLSADGWKEVRFSECRTVSKALAFGLKSLLNSLGKTVIVHQVQNSEVIQGRQVNARPIFMLRWRDEVDQARAQTFVEDGLEWCPVRSQHLAAVEADVFNIGVEEDESYIVEGIVVHNCKHFSKAKGKKPVSKKIRGLAWVVIRWAKRVRPRVIMLENVEEFADWGPVLPDGRPCPVRKGQTFRLFVQQLERQGYKVEYRELRACDFGAPTIRKRLFLIARRDGLPIVWPKPTHGPGRMPYRTAAVCIDWSIPCQSIFERKRPLAEATLRRIAKGVQRFVLDAADPFIVTFYGEKRADEFRGQSICEPLKTQTTENRHALVTAFLAKHYGDKGQRPGSPMQEPISTVTARDHHSLVTSHLVKLRNNCHGQDNREPLHTVTTGGHFGEVRTFLVKYNGTAVGQDLREPMHTITSKHRMGLVTIKGEDYQIVNIGMRMLEPRELYRAQGFPDSYIIDPVVNGKPLSKAAQVRMCGNSVPPQFSAALVMANFVHERMLREEVA